MANLLSTPPKDHFPHGAWPHGAPYPDAPPAVLYAAELANYLRIEAVDRARAIRLAKEAERAAQGAPPSGDHHDQKPDESPDRKRTESLTAGLHALEDELDVTYATLRSAADGTSWPSLALLAQVELYFDEDIASWGRVHARQNRGGVARHPAEAIGSRRRTKDASTSPGGR